VLKRCWAALYPRSNFLDVLEGNPDLYGPFWIATTVVFILFMTGTISWKLAATGKEHYSYDFSLLSGAAGLVYGYTAVIPVGLWATLKWFGSESANLMECWALYGYANLIWIPVSLISWSPLSRKFGCSVYGITRTKSNHGIQSSTTSSSVSALASQQPSSSATSTPSSARQTSAPPRSCSSLS
jgi:hypothetical protein